MKKPTDAKILKLIIWGFENLPTEYVSHGQITMMLATEKFDVTFQQVTEAINRLLKKGKIKGRDLNPARPELLREYYPVTDSKGKK